MKPLTRFMVTLCLSLLVTVPCGATSSAEREQEIRQVITTFVTSRTAGMGWEVRIRKVGLPPLLKLPEGGVEYEVVVPKQWEGWGKINAAVVARQNERVVSNIPVLIDVEAVADTVVTLRQIDHDTVISADDLVLQKREITFNSQLAVRSIAGVAGKSARSTLRANQPVRSDQIERVPLIKSGQMVTIIGENGVIKITMPGKAHSSGVAGDIIRVLNLTSQKEIPAQVIDSSTVKVAL